MITIQQVEEGVGLPAMYSLNLPGVDGEVETGVEMQSCGMRSGAFVLSAGGWLGPFSTEGATLRLIDHQTVLGLAEKLDEWERTAQERRGGCWLQDYWTMELVRKSRPQTKGEMIARIETIGLDHAIRRALGSEPEPGTLATLEVHKGRWVMSLNGQVLAQMPTLGTDLTAAEALRATYAEVCSCLVPSL